MHKLMYIPLKAVVTVSAFLKRCLVASALPKVKYDKKEPTNHNTGVMITQEIKLAAQKAVKEAKALAIVINSRNQINHNSKSDANKD